MMQFIAAAKSIDGQQKRREGVFCPQSPIRFCNNPIESTITH